MSKLKLDPNTKREPLSVQIQASTDKDVRKIAHTLNATHAYTVDLLLRDAAYWFMDDFAREALLSKEGLAE